jgi:uncharacterized protein (DUF1697 family)
MNELRSLFESLGHTEVSTLIQSGNIFFSTGTPIDRTDLETAIARRFHITTSLVLRTPSELRSVVRRNPFREFDSSKLHVGFLTHKPVAADVASLETKPFAPEECVVQGCELYFYLPNGMARTKLPAYVDRKLKVPTTIRNWNTVTTLVELAGG